MGKKGGWVDGQREMRMKGQRGGKLSLPWRKQQQKGEVGRAKITLERSDGFSL
jgi:hypothetical protein